MIYATDTFLPPGRYAATFQVSNWIPLTGPSTSDILNVLNNPSVGLSVVDVHWTVFGQQCDIIFDVPANSACCCAPFSSQPCNCWQWTPRAIGNLFTGFLNAGFVTAKFTFMRVGDPACGAAGQQQTQAAAATDWLSWLTKGLPITGTVALGSIAVIAIGVVIVVLVFKDRI